MGAVTVERPSHLEPFRLGHWPASLMAGAAPLGVCFLTNGLVAGPPPVERLTVQRHGLEGLSLHWGPPCQTAPHMFASHQVLGAHWPTTRAAPWTQPKTVPSGTAARAGGGSSRLQALAGLPIPCTLCIILCHCMCILCVLMQLNYFNWLPSASPCHRVSDWNVSI